MKNGVCFWIRRNSAWILIKPVKMEIILQKKRTEKYWNEKLLLLWWKYPLAWWRLLGFLLVPHCQLQLHFHIKMLCQCADSQHRWHLLQLAQHCPMWTIAIDVAQAKKHTHTRVQNHINISVNKWKWWFKPKGNYFESPQSYQRHIIAIVKSFVRC